MIQWYAIYSKWHHEKSVAGYLQLAGIDAYLPLRTERRRWKDRFVWGEFPLFPSYLFVHCELENVISKINRTRGVISLVGARFPESIPGYQIESLKRVLQTGLPYKKQEELIIGQEMLVTHGPLKGVRGILIEKRHNQMLVIKVELINQGISILIAKKNVIPYEQGHPTPCMVLNDPFSSA